ncbi:Stress response protein SCP2 [Nocardia amikacinitolerans]|uniref:VWA domain-containing protein n=1 Tax=Nocardia amikacinitolerans TaxID=756689 RepID=UPI00082AC6F1|nr:VWA domain-containing protein [Nocardia amikacinitolerans]MCP2315130.1 Stress response protein SCP2 [Nocardia amikacinitolerans]
MSSIALRKGENTALTGQHVTFSVKSDGTPIDVSALLLDSSGKVRSDSDLVFYNNPTRDGVEIAGTTVSVDFRRVPSDIARIVVVASIDPLSPGTVFSRAPQLVVTQNAGQSIEFTAPDFANRETVIVISEAYRRNDSWKLRGVGQGYASGLGGLAIDYGVDVETDEPAGQVGSVSTTGLGAPTDLAKVGDLAPALLPVATEASRALVGAGIGTRRAAVYLVLDHSYDMRDLYESFTVQAFAERILALSVNLDDDGTVPVVFSGRREPFVEDLSLENYRCRIGQLHTQVDWGWSQVDEAMRCVINHYQESGAVDPALVVVQVGDEPDDKSAVRTLLQNSATLGVFWIFVGFGRGKMAFYKNLNSSNTATFSNVAFYNVGKNPGAVPGEQFYTELVRGFSTWSHTPR